MLSQNKAFSIALTNEEKQMEQCVVRGGEYIKGEHSIAE